jgi:hypothetical protein
MTVRVVLSTVCLLLAVGSAAAQPPAATPPKVAIPPGAQTAVAPAPPNTPRPQPQPINIKVDVTLSDQRAGAAPIKRTVSVVVADGFSGLIRTQSEVMQVGPVPLNIDVNPTLLADGKVRVGINLQYDWPAPMESSSTPAARGTVVKTALHDTLALILESGKPMIAAQSADPIGDRQVTVEVKATILR